MLPLRNTLPDSLQNTLELLDRTDDPALDQLELGHHGCLHLLHSRRVDIDVGDSMLRIWVLRLEAILAAEGTEDGGEVLRELGGVRKEVRDRVRVRLAVLEELLCRLLYRLEASCVVVKFGVGGFCAPESTR